MLVLHVGKEVILGGVLLRNKGVQVYLKWQGFRGTVPEVELLHLLPLGNPHHPFLPNPQPYDAPQEDEDYTDVGKDEPRL